MKIFPAQALHSYYSLLRGIHSPDELCQWAQKEGLNHLSITDMGNFYGMINFIDTAEKYSLRAIQGINFSFDYEKSFLAYPKNQKGFSHLNLIISEILSQFRTHDPEPEKSTTNFQKRDARARLNHFKVNPSPALKQWKEQLKKQVQNSTPEIRSSFVLELFKKYGWQDILLIISPGPQYDGIISTMEQTPQKIYPRENIKLAALFGLPYHPLLKQSQKDKIDVVPIQGGQYFDEMDRRTIELLRAIDTNTTIDQLSQNERVNEHSKIASTKDFLAYFEPKPELLRNTAIFEALPSAGTFISSTTIFPQFDGLNEEDSYKRLCKLCMEGLERRYPHDRTAALTRLKHELGIIKDKSFASYFLTVQNIVSQAPRTCGRGSAASSIVSYLLGITHVEPLQFDLFFERFLNRARKDPPDCDIDFPWDERESILAYVMTKYKGYSAMVAEHTRFAKKSAVRESCKALGYSDEEIDRCMMVLSRGEFDSLPAELVNFASRIRNIPRHISVHPGGVVITPKEIENYTHIESSAMGWPVIAWEKDGAERAGLVKIDLLGNRALAVIRDCLELVNQRRSSQIGWENFDPLKDPGAQQLIESSDTVGIFYAESPATRQLLKKMKSGSYENLIIATSIIRPAAHGFINDYVHRLHGGDYEKFGNAIDEVLKETYGIMVYQEDIARIAIAIAGFSAEEADALRKVLTKNYGENRVEEFKSRFFLGTMKNGVSKERCELLWSMIESFQGYSFCKSHSASYALVSYKMAWLKYFYPGEFMVSLINNGGGLYGRQTYINAAQRMGFSIIPADINLSRMEYQFHNGSIIIGLSQLKQVSLKSLKTIIEERDKRGSYSDFEDFYWRVHPSHEEVKVLIRAGVFDGLETTRSRPQLIWLSAYLMKQEQIDFYGAPAPPSFIHDYSMLTKAKDELELLGLKSNINQLELLVKRSRAFSLDYGHRPLIQSHEIKAYLHKKVYLAGIYVIEKPVRTKNHKSMCFVSFEDGNGIYETVLFPKAYEQNKLILHTSFSFVIEGYVDEEFGAYTINVTNLVSLDQ